MDSRYLIFSKNNFLNLKKNAYFNKAIECQGIKIYAVNKKY